MQRRIDTRLKPSATPPQDNVVSNQAQATVPTKIAFDESGELEQASVLYSFLEDRYKKKVGVCCISCDDIWGSEEADSSRIASIRYLKG